MSNWNIEQAAEVYNIAEWSEQYFAINQNGKVIADPHKNNHGIELSSLVDEIQQAGLSLPVLIRFNNILQQRLFDLTAAFRDAQAKHDYTANYQAVYPIKVNQQRRVVEALVNNNNVNLGLEAGSKAELLAVLALSEEHGSVIICNGYKDREYIRLALIGRQLGHQVYIILEQASELQIVLEEADKMQVTPLLGIRVRLASIGKGNWQNTGGEKSKFGLRAFDVLNVIEALRSRDQLDNLKLLHAHMGSQISNIRDIQKGMQEISRYYAELRQAGADINTVDVGGGLGVDYEGTSSRGACSINYSMQSYADHIVQALAEICVAENIPQPNIITEAGRAMTAHHAVLITNVIDIENNSFENYQLHPQKNEPQVINDLWQVYTNISSRSVLNAYNDANHWLAESQSLYIHGMINLEQRSRAEQIYYMICHKIKLELQLNYRSHREINDELNEKLAEKLFCNFSLFQSIPDSWGIDQVFPIMPLSGLDQEPTRRGVIQDITCDSDGAIHKYVDGCGVETTLPLPPKQTGTPELIGIFLVGAYQEILGDMHNLFGDTDSVHVQVELDGSYKLLDPLQGDTVDHVLRYVHLDSKELLTSLKIQLDTSALADTEKETYLSELERGFQGYTYHED